MTGICSWDTDQDINVSSLLPTQLPVELHAAQKGHAQTLRHHTQQCDRAHSADEAVRLASQVVKQRRWLHTQAREDRWHIGWYVALLVRANGA